MRFYPYAVRSSQLAEIMRYGDILVDIVRSYRLPRADEVGFAASHPQSPADSAGAMYPVKTNLIRLDSGPEESLVLSEKL